MTAGSGLSSAGLFEPVDAVGSSLRIRVAFYLCQKHPAFSVTWKERATKSGLCWWEPITSERHSDETASGSSDNWPTPLAADGRAKGIGGFRNTLSLAYLAKTGMAWPTPKARDAKGMSQRGTHAPGDALANMVHVCRAGQPDPANPNTTGKPQDWCTPTANLGTAGNTSRSGGRKSELLLTGQARVTTSGGGSLNPDWVAQLQGFPSDWCHLPDETLSRLMAMPSSQTVPK